MIKDIASKSVAPLLHMEGMDMKQAMHYALGQGHITFSKEIWTTFQSAVAEFVYVIEEVNIKESQEQDTLQEIREIPT